MVITAHNIGDSVDGLLVEVEGLECTGLRLLTPGPPARIRCSIQNGVGKGKQLKITTAIGLWAEIGFNYKKPEVQHCTRPPTSGGDIVVTGLNFGRASRDVEVLIGRDLDLILANESRKERSEDTKRTDSRVETNENPHEMSSSLAPTKHAPPRRRRRSAILLEQVNLLRPHCALRCHVPPGVGKDIPIVVNVAGQHAEGHFSYAPPRIFSVANVNAHDGILRVAGANLGSEADLDRISVKIILDSSGAMNKSNVRRDSIAEPASSEPPATVFFATNLQISQPHTELVCHVLSPFHKAISTHGHNVLSADLEQGLQARVIVNVAEQTSPPENFRFLPPPRLAPEHLLPHHTVKTNSTSEKKASPLQAVIFQESGRMPRLVTLMKAAVELMMIL